MTDLTYCATGEVMAAPPPVQNQAKNSLKALHPQSASPSSVATALEMVVSSRIVLLNALVLVVAVYHKYQSP